MVSFLFQSYPSFHSFDNRTILINQRQTLFVCISLSFVCDWPSVKWLESAGAASIPIPYDSDEDLVNEIFSQINGILFPGGSSRKCLKNEEETSYLGG